MRPGAATRRRERVFQKSLAAVGSLSELINKRGRSVIQINERMPLTIIIKPGRIRHHLLADLVLRLGTIHAPRLPWIIRHFQERMPYGLYVPELPDDLSGQKARRRCECRS